MDDVTRTDEEKILIEARERFRHAQNAESENRDEAVDDLRFRAGEQWPQKLKAERERDGRPCMTTNKLPAYIRQVVNEIRQIRPSIKVRPVDGQSDPETAEILNGMIRAIEADSSAESAYDWAAEYAATMGWGYWRVTTDYADDVSCDQVIKIERIRNPFGVYVDPAAKQQDGSDMRYAFIVEQMPRAAFDKQYPDATGEWSEGGEETKEWWWNEEHVRIAEYWCVKEENYVVSLVPDGMGGSSIVPEAIEGAPQRTVTDRKVVQYLMTGGEILETNEWPGRYIPICRVVGDELDIEGELILKGMVRDAKEPVRAYNYHRSAEIERTALYSKAPWIGPEGFDVNPKWKLANKKNYATLTYKPVPGAPDGGRPTREPPPEASSAMITQTQLASDEVKQILGLHDASMGAQSNEISGVAINRRRAEGDVSNFHFVDNLAKAMTYCGKVLVDLIPKIYTGERIVRILRPDGTDESVQLNKPYIDNQMRERNFNLTAGRYDVTVDIGPSYATQREEAADSIMEFMRAMPQAAQVAGDLVAKNMDWPDADEISKRLKLLMPPEILANENPQFKAAMQQKDQQLQMMQGQLQQAMQAIQQLQQALGDKSREADIKAADLANKVQKTLNDYAVDMTKLELEAGRDLAREGVAY